MSRTIDIDGNYLDNGSMDINLMEQRELADYIGRKVSALVAVPNKSEEYIASVIWGAIEDYCGVPDPTPDPEDMGRADDFQDHYFTRDR